MTGDEGGLALDGDPDSQTRDYLEKIRISSDIMLDLVNDSTLVDVRYRTGSADREAALREVVGR